MKRIFTRGLLMGLAAALASPAVAADAPKAFKVERIADIDYCDIPNDPDLEQHRLDVFRPVGKDDCPVVFFVHGGGWMIGDKDDVFGIYGYGTIAESIARRGVVVVLPNYRLSPKAKHPDHIKDVALRFRVDAPQHRQIRRSPRPDLRLRPLRRRPPRFPPGDRRELPQGRGPVQQGRKRRGLDQRCLRRGRFRP